MKRKQKRPKTTIAVVPALFGQPQSKYRDYNSFSSSLVTSTIKWFSNIADLTSAQGVQNNQLIGNQAYVQKMDVRFIFNYVVPVTAPAVFSTNFILRFVILDPKNYSQTALSLSAVYPSDLVTPVDYQQARVLADENILVGTPISPSIVTYAGYSPVPTVAFYSKTFTINKVVVSDPGTNLPQNNGIGFYFYNPAGAINTCIQVIGNIRTYYTSY